MTKDKIKLVKAVIGLASVTALVTIAGSIYQTSATSADATAMQADPSSMSAPAFGPGGSASGSIFGGNDSYYSNGGGNGNGQGYASDQGQGLFASPQSGFSGRTRSHHS